MIRICPSILNANHQDLPGEMAIVSTDADLIHLDIMDNIFVPNMTFSLTQAKEIIGSSPLPVDTHLMVINPDEVAVEYAKAGSKSVSFHLEASSKPEITIKCIKDSGARAGVALKPDSDFSEVAEFMNHLDMLLIMTVEPGFGGQSFMESMMPKVEQARKYIGEHALKDIWLQVDGGISLETIARAAQAGADTFVAGSAIYKSPDPAAVCRELRAIASR